MEYQYQIQSGDITGLLAVLDQEQKPYLWDSQQQTLTVYEQLDLSSYAAVPSSIKAQIED